MPQANLKPTCSFCQPEVKQIQEILRTLKTRLIYPRSPAIKENFLIIPKRHVKHLCNLKKEEMIDIHKMVKIITKVLREKYSFTGFNLFINDGQCAGQHIPHVHFHYFARSKSEKISPFKILNNPKRYKNKRLSEEKIRERAEEFRKIFLPEFEKSLLMAVKK